MQYNLAFIAYWIGGNLLRLERVNRYHWDVAYQ